VTYKPIFEYITRVGIPHPKICEVGPGRGVFLRYFQNIGIPAVGHDVKKEAMRWFGSAPLFVDNNSIEYHNDPQDLEYLKVAARKGEILFFCWPPLEKQGDMIAFNALKVFYEASRDANKKAHVIYFGKDRGKDTAGPKFFDVLVANFDSVINSRKDRPLFNSRTRPIGVLARNGELFNFLQSKT